MSAPKNWSREKRAETEDVPFIWNHTKSKRRVILVKDESEEYAEGKLYYSELYNSEENRAKGDDPLDVIAEGTNRREVKKMTNDWLSDHPYADSKYIRQVHENLSESAQELLKETGYHEVHLNFFWEDDPEKELQYLTVGVVDEDVPEVRDDENYEEDSRYRQEWVARNLPRLIQMNHILYASGDGIDGVNQLKTYKDDIQTIH